MKLRFMGRRIWIMIGILRNDIVIINMDIVWNG